MDISGKDEEKLLSEALQVLRKLYQEFGIAFTYGEIAKNPKEHERLVEFIDSFGPMPCNIMPVNSEKLAEIIEDAIAGKVD